MIEMYPLLTGVIAATTTTPVKQAPKRIVRAGHVCDDCHSPCQGGCEDYLSISNQPRHGCADHQACAKRWVVRLRET